MSLVSITDIQSSKSLTGFQMNAVVSDNVDISGNVTSITRKVQAYRLKVDKLTRLDLFLNNFFGLRDSDINDQYITRFKGDMKMSVYIGADTLFTSKTTLDDIDPDGDLVTAGAFKLAEYTFTEPEEGNIVNVSQEYPERSVPVDLAAIKTEKSIVSSEVSLFIFVITSGNINILNASKSIKGSYIFNFAVRGSRFFFTNPGMSESDAITAGFLKEAGVTSAGFIKENKVYSGSDLNNTDFPIGSVISVNGNTVSYNRNQSASIKIASGDNRYFCDPSLAGTYLSGTWRARGVTDYATGYYLFERVA